MVKTDITREITIWKGIKQRCLNPNNKDYPHYGGRGIKLDERWLRSFYEFYHDMGPCPEGYSIERKDVNGDYEPSNCIWADQYVQRRNTQRTHWVEFNDTRIPLVVYCDLFSLDYKLTHSRLKRGWTIEQCTNSVLPETHDPN